MLGQVANHQNQVLPPAEASAIELPHEQESSSPREVLGPHNLVPEAGKNFSLIDKTAETQYFALIQKWDERAESLHASSEQTPVPVNEGLGLHYSRISLYHGGATTGITDFLAAEETTIGNGFYTTSMPDQAFGYATARADKRIKVGDTITTTGSSPVVYEVEVTDATFLDLRDSDNRQRVMKEFAQYLEGWLEVQKQREGLTWRYERYLATVADRIGIIHEHEGNLPHGVGLKGVLQHTSSIFTEFVTGLGYDGAIGLEGGEGGYTDQHDSWVIMDPSRAKVTNETTFLTPLVSDDDAWQAHRAEIGKIWKDTPAASSTD